MNYDSFILWNTNSHSVYIFSRKCSTVSVGCALWLLSNEYSVENGEKSDFTVEKLDKAGHQDKYH